MRDGRDLVSSTVRTWPQEKFSKVCTTWKNSADHMMAFKQFYDRNKDNYQLVKYEEIIARPKDFVTSCCDWFDLDIEKYPFPQIDELAFRGSSTLQAPGEVNWEPIKSDKSAKTVGHWRHWSARQTKQFKKLQERH